MDFFIFVVLSCKQKCFLLLLRGCVDRNAHSMTQNGVFMQYGMESFFQKDFSSRLRQLRGDLTLVAFAKKLGYNGYQTYDHYEKGTRKPTIDLLLRLNRFCGVSVDWLLGVSQQNGEGQSAPNHAEILHKAEAIITCAEEMKSALSNKINALKGCL